jgi:hypothetical protein
MSSDEKRLRRLFQSLPQVERDTLLAFAEFLASRVETEVVAQEPLAISRPPTESVVAAIKRLSATYPMLDKATMLNDTSALMSQHVLTGRPAAEVIDELEALFAKHYAHFSAQ